MNVQSLLNRKGSDVVTIDPQTTLQVAAHMMQHRNIAALVVAANGNAIGLLTSREVVGALSGYGAQSADLRVAAVMRTDFLTVSPEDTLKRVMALMTNHRVTHMPVMTGGRLHGIVSIGDIVKYRLEELELEASVLRDVYIAAQ